MTEPLDFDPCEPMSFTVPSWNAEPGGKSDVLVWHDGPQVLIVACGSEQWLAMNTVEAPSGADRFLLAPLSPQEADELRELRIGDVLPFYARTGLWSRPLVVADIGDIGMVAVGATTGARVAGHLPTKMCCAP